MNISERDLTKLAILLNKTVYSADFPENGKYEEYAEKTLRLIDILERKYSNVSMLRSIRDAIEGISADKTGFYIVARDLLKMVHKSVRFREVPSDTDFFDFPLSSIPPKQINTSAFVAQ
ncbi:MAG: hypothetical protein KTR32_02075 [Granulosicoccus sp.]|nr:hypothetical protein [Granulosicoccus sp.]